MLLRPIQPEELQPERWTPYQGEDQATEKMSDEAVSSDYRLDLL